MASISYSFIDIAVLDRVRTRFATGDALVILATDLDEIIWTNGPGASLLGYPNIEAAIGAAPGLSPTALRQIRATPGFPDIAKDRTVSVRLARGAALSVVNFQTSAITLPGGERALLLAHPFTTPTEDKKAPAAAAVLGFDTAGQFAAMIDSQGNVCAASDGFDALGIERETLAGLVAEVRAEADRLVKHVIPAAPRRLPAGFARLTDDPALHLLVVVDEAEDTQVRTDNETPHTPEEPASSRREIPAEPARADEAAAHTAGTVRFAWRTDAESRFTALSQEFAEAVGAPAADVIGRRFRDVSNAFGLDPEGRIAALLERRDTWSGRTVMWPVAGTDKKIPVDLAALPVYGRSRDFQGFHGFGLARMADATTDPEGVGLVLKPGAPMPAPEGKAQSSLPPASGTAPGQEGDEKIIRLAERRSVEPPRILSLAEQTAFQEIGDRLRRDSVEDADDGDLAAEDRNEADTQPPTPAEDEAAQADADFADGILASLPLPILVHSGDVLHYANRAFFEFTGHRSLAALEQQGGIGALFVDPYEDETSGSAGRRKMRLRTAAGEEFDVESHLQSVPWGTGKALLLALQRSVDAPEAGSDEDNASTTQLQMHLAEMRAIIDTATDGVAIIAEDGTVRSTNQPAEALFGFDAEDVAGKPFTALFAIESQRAVEQYLESLSDNGVASVLNDGLEVIGREAQGRFIPLFMTIGRLPHGSGFCAVLRDITQWKRAEEELTQARAEAEKASSQKTDFLARVSHEIRTPLNAIIGFSELMIDEKFGSIGNDRYRDYLCDINESGKHVLDLVNDLLDISKIEAGQQELHYEAVSLNETLGQTVAMMQPQANRERVIIRSSFASSLPDVVADPRSVRQIALNLLSNAVRYTPAGGQVIVSTAYGSDGSVVMRVRDTGVGMSTAEIDEAMKPFKQINSLKRKRGDGTGLGLPLTRALVEANRATFSINSAPGEGTLVEIFFPPTRVLAD